MVTAWALRLGSFLTHRVLTRYMVYHVRMVYGVLCMLYGIACTKDILDQPRCRNFLLENSISRLYCAL